MKDISNIHINFNLIKLIAKICTPNKNFEMFPTIKELNYENKFIVNNALILIITNTK